MTKCRNVKKQERIERNNRLEAINVDPGVSRLAFCVAYRISVYVNADEGCAWPSQTTLARDLQICVRSVRNALSELEQRGHISVSRHKGRGKTNKVAFTPASDAAKRKNGGSRMPINMIKNRHDVADQDEASFQSETGTAVPKKPAPVCRENSIDRNSLDLKAEISGLVH